MPVHGFASSSLFEVVDQSDCSVVLELCETVETLASYPFPFRLRVHYVLSGVALSVRVEVTNTGAGHLPYACGFHPGFAWPFGESGQNTYRIEFSNPEKPDLPIIAAGGLFSDSTRALAFDGQTLPLSPDLFAHEALCFLDARSRRVSLIGPGGAIVAEAAGFRHWALWSRPGAPFLCIEAWTGHGDPEGFDGDFSEKPSLEHLKAGETRRHDLILHWQAA